MKNYLQSLLFIVISLTVFSCNKDKSPTAHAMKGLLMDHCGGVIVTFAKVELWKDAVDKFGNLNDTPEELLETTTSDSKGMFYFSDYSPDYAMSVRYTVPGIGPVSLAAGNLYEALHLDLETLYTEGSETDAIFSWTKDSTWSNADTIKYSILPGSAVYPLQSNTTIILDTVDNVRVYTKMFDESDPAINLKWKLGIRYKYSFGLNSTILTNYGYFDLCPLGYQEMLVGAH